MRTMKAGALLLSVWSGFNGVVASVVTALTLSGRSPPALSMMFTEPEIPRLDGRVISVVNAQAALANPCVVALCILVVVVTWKGVVRKARWAFLALAATLVPLQVFGFVSDGFVGHHNIAANITSTALLAAGLTLTGHEIFRQSSAS
jgi:hypothetical protein